MMGKSRVELGQVVCVSIATNSLDSLLPMYTNGLGFQVTAEPQVSPRGFGLRWVELGSAGRTTLELLEPTGAGGPVDRFLAQRGGGVYQVRFHVSDLPALSEQLRDRGVTVIDGERVSGHPDVGWIHPKSTGGVLYELMEQRDSR
jgi:methylmalonyl-CoA/ethylmalonyl-CoA epimerase